MIIKKLFNSLFSIVRNSECDKNSSLSYMVKFYNSKLEKYSYVSNNCNIFHTKIGKFTSIGLGCNIGGGEHTINWVSTSPAFLAGRTIRWGLADNKFSAYKETIIGNDVWIASNVIIKSGVRISDGAVIGAGAVVTKDVGPYEIWAGNPARFIKKRFEDEIINKLMDIQWWNWDDDTIRKYGKYFNDIEGFLKIAEANLAK